MIRACPACQTQNRIPSAHLADKGRCGACKTALPPLAEPLEVDAAEFFDIVRNAKVPILVDFWAPWCGPCQMAAPEVKKAAAERAGKAIVLKVNTDEAPELANRFNIRGIPHFILLHQGETLLSQSGLAKAPQLLQWIDKANTASRAANEARFR